MFERCDGSDNHRCRGGSHRVAGSAVGHGHGGGESENARDAARRRRHVGGIRNCTDERVDVAPNRNRQRIRGTDGGLYAIHEGILEAPNIVDRHADAGRGQRDADARIAAEIGVEQRVAGDFIQAASRLLTVDVGVLQKLAGDAHAARHHVEVGGGSIVIDRQRILLDAPGGRRQAVVEVGIGRGSQGRRHGRLQTGPGFGKRLTDTDGNDFAIRASPITKARPQRLLELAFQEALLNDRLQGQPESSEWA